MFQHRVLGYQVGSAAFPQRPGACSLALDFGSCRGQAPVVGTDQIISLIFWDDAQVLFPQLGMNTACTLLVEPLDVLVSA